MQHEPIITAESVVDLQNKIIFLERELADAAMEEIMLHDVIANLSKRIQVLEQKLGIIKPSTPYQY